MLKQAFSPLLSLAILAAPLPALAAKKSFVIDGSRFTSTFGFTPYPYGLGLQDVDNAIAAVNVVLPRDYRENTPVKIKLRMLSKEASCGIHLAASSVNLFRLGSLMSDPSPAGDGFSNEGPDVFTVPSAYKVFQKDFLLEGASEGSVIGQKPGDHITMFFVRSGTAVEDTCTGELVATSVKVIYSSN